MADHLSKYDQVRKLREARALASERPAVKTSTEVPGEKEIVVPKNAS
jgi:hypothetical protein